MNSTNDTAVVAGRASGQTTRPHRLRRLVGTGVIATLGATAATTLAATLAQAVGVDFEVSNDGGPIPLAGFAVMTGFFSVEGIVIAAALSSVERSPFRANHADGPVANRDLLRSALAATDPTTTAPLGLHLVAATVVIPALARSVRTRTD